MTHAGIRLVFAVALTAVTVLPFGAEGAEELSVATFDNVYRTEGLYEYNKDGVPLLGLITTRIGNARVKFTTCSKVTMEVDFKQLKSSAAKCPGKKDPGVWPWASNTMVPLVKQGSAVAMVKFNGKDIDLSGLTGESKEVYKDALSNAKNGDWIGYAFKGDDGKKSLWLITPPAQ